jgi:hypothetical protein
MEDTQRQRARRSLRWTGGGGLSTVRSLGRRGGRFAHDRATVEESAAGRTETVEATVEKDGRLSAMKRTVLQRLQRTRGYLRLHSNQVPPKFGIQDRY